MSPSDHTYVLILAGGEGVRFAPLSTPERPKQFLTLFDNRTLLQQTVDRLRSWLPTERVWVSTQVRYRALVLEQLPDCEPTQIFGETAKRNTAPAIAHAAWHLMRADPEAVMIVLPSDHVIGDCDAFIAALDAAAELAVRTHGLVTLGIEPAASSTEYGYILRGDRLPDILRPAYRVARFVEKPDAARAVAYVADGGYVWNSGMFIWEAATILAEIHRWRPQLADTLGRDDFFERAEAVSIDYGVMEHSSCAAVVPCAIGWSDIGSWGSLKALVERERLIVHPSVQRILDAMT